MSKICENCGHAIFYDYIERIYHHKRMLHNDNCDCRDPWPKRR